jgi:hypothetical protein
VHKISLGLCQCGCGGKTSIATRNHTQWGHVKGQPLLFLVGHGARKEKALRRVPEYHIYNGAKSRCSNPKHIAYKYYGGRGIKFKFKNFEQFFAELGPRLKGKTLDRINNNGNYEPGNVKWSTRAEQSSNRENYTHKVRHGTGVYWHKRAGKWIAYLWYMGKPLYLGLFRTKKEAKVARQKALKERGL